jgi:ribonuclease P protein component
MPVSRHTFSKDERLRSKMLIEKIVAGGKSVQQPPFRMSWVVTPLKKSFPAQLAIAVPKRFFKRAVDRNRIRRLVREVYRKNKSGIYTLLRSKNIQCAILLVYSGRTVPGYAEVEKKFLLTLQRFEEAILKNPG